MAESNQRKIADPIKLNDDDPFAELTRIMGFDPRVGIASKPKAADVTAPATVVQAPRPVLASVVAQPAAPQPASAAAVDDDDFGIDLEKELMGEFADFETAPQAPLPAATVPGRYQEAASQPNEVEVGTDVDDEFHDAFTASFEQQMPDVESAGQHSPVVQAEIAAPQAGSYGPAALTEPEMPEFDLDLTPELELDLAPDFDLAPATEPEVAAEPDIDMAAEPDPHRAAEFERNAVAAPELDVDAELELDPAADFELAPATGLEVAAEPDFDIAAEPDRHRAAEFDRNAVAAPELDLDAELELDLAPDFDLAPATELEVTAEPNFDMAAEPDGHRAAKFDRDAVAAAELDLDAELELDLAPDFELAPATELDLAPEPGHDVAAAPGFDIAGEPDLELTPEFELEELDFSEPLYDHPAEAAAPRFEDAPAYADEVPANTEEALHEASDLPAPGGAAVRHDALAEVDMDFTGAFERAIESEHDASADAENPSPMDPWAVEPETQNEQGQQPAASDSLELSLEEELDAFLNASPEPLRPERATVLDIAPEPARQSAYPANSRWAALEDEQEEVAPEIAVPPAPAIAASEPRRPFINPALISRHANFKVAAPAAAAPTPVPAEPQDDLDELLAAMESEVHGGGHLPAQAEAAPANDAVTARSAETSHDHGTSEQALAERTNSAPAYARHDDEVPARYAYDAAPDIETIDVPETAVAMADDLDIPELAYEEDEPAGQVFDDIDADFAAAYGETSPSEEPAGQPAKPSVRAVADLEALYRPSITYPSSGANSMVAVDARVADAAAIADFDDGTPFDSFEVEATKTPVAGDHDRFVDLDFDSDVDEEMAVPAYAPKERVAPQRRSMMIAAIVGGVALLGGVGALALSFGSSGGADAPVVVKADDGPVKIKPENPGGTTVPNQDNKVYDAVKGASGTSTAPVQERLVTTAEEPVDMAAVDQPDTMELPGLAEEQDIIPKAGDRVDALADGDQSMNAPEGVIVTPRKVKTMVVLSDGTLVAREDPTPAEPSIADTATAAAPQQPSAGDETAALKTDPVTTDKTAADNKLQPAFQSPGSEDAVAVKPVKSEKVEGTVVPEAGAVAPAPPAAVDGEANPEQVATANVEPVAVASGAWSVQIASQPSAESANANYQDLARRYAGVIGGRGVNIVKAEITGKGTYWRVRVPAKSRDDAINLCNDYKAAGGNCFVSK